MSATAASAAESPRPNTSIGWVVTFWGALGVVAILAVAVARLLPIALEPLGGPLAWHHFVAYGASIASMAFAEGYRGFQEQFSPRVVMRSFHLGARPGLVGLLAPLVAMGLLHATRRRLAAAWGLTGGLVLLVLVVHGLEQPWRGAIDAGVVVGLCWGIGSILWYLLRGMAGTPRAVPADMPER